MWRNAYATYNVEVVTANSRVKLVEMNLYYCYTDGCWFNPHFSWLRATQRWGCNTKDSFRRSRCRCHTQEFSSSSLQIRRRFPNLQYLSATQIWICWTPRDSWQHMIKIIIAWMIFSSKLLSSFSLFSSTYTQAHNQIGTPGVVKSFLRGAQITMSNSFQLCPHIFPGARKILQGGFAFPWLRACLHYRQTNTSSGNGENIQPGLDRLGATHSWPFAWVATNTLGTTEIREAMFVFPKP